MHENPEVHLGIEDARVGVEDNVNNEYPQVGIEPIVADDQNELEYRNGQASVRELFNRPVPQPAVGAANRRHNSGSEDNDNTNNLLPGIYVTPAAGHDDATP